VADRNEKDREEADEPKRADSVTLRGVTRTEEGTCHPPKKSAQKDPFHSGFKKKKKSKKGKRKEKRKHRKNYVKDHEKPRENLSLGKPPRLKGGGLMFRNQCKPETTKQRKKKRGGGGGGGG